MTTIAIKLAAAISTLGLSFLSAAMPAAAQGTLNNKSFVENFVFLSVSFLFFLP